MEPVRDGRGQKRPYSLDNGGRFSSKAFLCALIAAGPTVLSIEALTTQKDTLKEHTRAQFYELLVQPPVRIRCC
jgi:hypothetical protein